MQAPTRLTPGDLWAIVQMQRRLVVVSVVVCVVAATLYSLVAPRTYRAVATLHVSAAIGQEVETDTVVDLESQVRFNRNLAIKTQLELMETRAFRMKVLERYQELGVEPALPADDAGIAELGTMVEGAVRQGTELVDITVLSTSPELSARIAQLTAEVYRDENLAAHTEATRGALVWLEKEIAKAEGVVEATAEDLRAYQGAEGLEDVESSTNTLSSQMGRLNEAYGAARTERVAFESRLRGYEKLFREARYHELADAMATPVLSDLSARYSAALVEQANAASRYGPKWPGRKPVDDAVENLKREIRSEAERALLSERALLQILESGEQRLAAEIAGSKGSLLDVARRRVGYERKKLEYEAARATYARLTERMGNLELQARTQLNNVRVAEDARVPKKPVSPNVPVNLVLGLFGGLVLGLGLGFGREYFDDTLSSPIEVKAFLGAPFLGFIPKFAAETDDRRDNALYTFREPRSQAAEAVRSIRTILELSPSGMPRRMLVTSAVSSEGKTTTTVSLAIAFANLQRRVLVIDADLRRPRIHKVFGVSREKGFSSLLKGEATPEDVIVPTEVPNLFIVPAGPGTDHANELLATARVPEVLQQLGHFDLVLIDTPPSVLLADARSLSRYADGVVLVVRENRTSRNLAREAVAGLHQVGANVLGVAMNAVDFNTRRTSYKYHYGYGYRYDKYYEDEPNDAAAK